MPTVDTEVDRYRNAETLGTYEGCGSKATARLRLECQSGLGKLAFAKPRAALIMLDLCHYQRNQE